jgi:DNA replication protein DnaC
MKKKFICEKHGEVEGEMFNLWGLKERIFCPFCQEEDEREREKKDRERIAAMERERNHSRYKLQGIAEMYMDEDFETFEAYTPALKGLLQDAKAFAENPVGKLVMLGGNGAGKNHLAIAVIKRAGGRIHTAYEINLMLRQTYGGDSNEMQVLDELCKASGVLVIDEIGRTKGSEWELNWMSHIINKRHENYRPVILISNRHLRRDCKHNGCDMCLEKYLENDVISRLLEDGKIMKFDCADYRVKKRLLVSGGK